jgi:hypothetical protein
LSIPNKRLQWSTAVLDVIVLAARNYSTEWIAVISQGTGLKLTVEVTPEFPALYYDRKVVRVPPRGGVGVWTLDGALTR